MPFIDASGMKINFPYDPYPCQVDYMEKVVQSLQTGNNAILESPTGTGKTLCLLCACLAWLENKKAQIGNIRWKAENAGQEMPDFMKENVSSDYRNELTKMLDTAAGSWNGEMGAPKIIYASRTHSQLNQAMQEFKKTSYRYLKACVIGSREQLCIHSQVAKETNNTTKVHLCRSKVSSRSCHFFNNVETFKTQVVDQVLDIEDLVGLGQKNNVCPYYLTRELKKDADLIFMPYNYLLDPKSRKAHGVELQGNILIFDEAHNLERICEESASFDFSSSDLASAISDINRIIQKVQEWQSTEISASADSESPAVFDYSMEDVLAYKSCLLKFEEQIDCIPVSGEGETFPGEKIFEILSEVGLTLSTKSAFQELTDKMISTLANDATNAVFSSRGGGLAKFGDVMQVVFTREPPEKMDFKSYIGIVSKHYKVHLKVEAPRIKKKVEVWTENVPQSKMGRVLSYWCFNPGYTMADLRNNGVKLIILTSGTLSPLTSFISEFGIDFPVRLENSHVITQKQVSIGSLEKSPDNKLLSSAYENRFRGEYLEGLAYTIINFAKIIPKGVLVFFPSYPVMEKSLEHWKTCGLRDRLEALKPIFVEPKSKSEFSLAMLGFYEKIRDSAGAIFMAVCRGKVSEGLDFADNNGRGVIITGLPYPPRMDARVKLKMQFLDETRKTSNTGLSGQDWYVQQASRAVNQAIGRVIRHKNDFGVILLCDARFSKFRQQLPLWLRSVMKVHQNFGAAQLEVKQFFKNFDSEIDHTSSIVTTKCVQSNDNFSVGSSFEIIGGKNNKVLKASAVVNHYASLCDDNYPDDFLAQYSRPAKVPAQPVQSKKGLLSALNAAEESTSSKLTKAQDSLQTSSKNHIFSKSKNSTEIQIKNRRTLLLPSINSYLQEIRKVFSNETYCEFKQVLSDYRVDHDVNKLLEKLERLFDILEPNNLFIIVGLCKFIRPSDRGTFKELCSNIIGPSFEEALGPSLPEEEKVDDPVKSPPNKRLKLEHCTNKSTCQTTMMDHFIKKDTEKASLTVQGHIKSSHSSVNMDSKSHLQTGSHLSSQGLKLQSKLTSKSPEKPKNVKLQSTKEMTSTTTCLKNEMAIIPKKCPLCDNVHEGPLAKSSVCGHSCCRICWEKALKSTKSCTFCGSKLKRKYLQLGYFLS